MMMMGMIAMRIKFSIFHLFVESALPGVPPEVLHLLRVPQAAPHRGGALRRRRHQVCLQGDQQRVDRC